MINLYLQIIYHIMRNFGQFTPQIANRVYIDPQAAVIGRVTIGDDSSIWPMASVRGDVHDITIGKKTNIQDNSVLHATHPSIYNTEGFPLKIGDEVTVGHSVILHACTVGNQCLIGMGSIVLDGAIIQDHVLLGAGSLVPPGKVLESGHLWLGNPVKKIRPLTQTELEFFLYSANHYVKLKDQYLG